MMNKIFTKIFSAAIVLGLCISCQDNSNTESTSNVTFTFTEKTTSTGRTQTENVASIVISVESEAGEAIYSEEKISVLAIGDSYLAEPVVFSVGNYALTKFLVLNDDDEIIYATPLAGSELSSLVTNPLPINFSVISGQISDLAIEVISTDSIEPEDLGYTTLSFNINPTFDILLCVASLNTAQDGYTFIESDLTIAGNGETLYTRALGDSINIVKIRSDFDLLSFSIESNGKASQTIELTPDSLEYYRTTPLKIILTSNSNSSLEDGLIAFYPFNGNADDEGVNNLDGVLGDGESDESAPTLTSDRHGNTNSAYSFDGNDYIDLSENTLFDLGDYEEFSISCWIRPSSSHGNILSKYIAASDNRMWRLGLNDDDNDVEFAVHDLGVGETRDVVETPFSEAWQNVTVVLDNSVYTMYIDGTERSSTPKSSTMLANSPTAKTLIGAVHHSNVIFDVFYTGDIDDVRLYDRALMLTEVGALSAL